MNLVAHQYLSFDIRDIQVGNMLGEIVRGKNYLKYPPLLSLGILLHRNIDSFTDSHPLVKESTKIFQPEFGKFSPIIIDVVYDYFLIKNWETFSKVPFDQFTSQCYHIFQTDNFYFDEKLKKIIKIMIKNNWFKNYSTYEGIGITLQQLSNKTKFVIEMELALKDLYLNESLLEEHFLSFFPQIINFCKDFINKGL